MTFTDTHSHLYDEAFAGEEDLAIARSVEAGVTKIIFPDIDSQTRGHMFEIARRHEGTVFPCLGLHPTSVDAGWKKEMEKMEEFSSEKIRAIGEIGMDCYWSKEFIAQQEEVFAIQLEDKPGEAARVLALFAEADISIAYMYSFLLSGKGILVFRSSDTEKTKQVIADKSLQEFC
jgi:hypothetical protein